MLPHAVRSITTTCFFRCDDTKRLWIVESYTGLKPILAQPQRPINYINTPRSILNEHFTKNIEKTKQMSHKLIKNIRLFYIDTPANNFA